MYGYVICQSIYIPVFLHPTKKNKRPQQKLPRLSYKNPIVVLCQKFI